LRLDPRTKLTIIVLLSTLSVLSVSYVYLLVVAAASMLINILLKVNIVRAFIKIKGLMSLIIFISIMQSLVVKGGYALVKIGSFYLITTGGLISGAEFALRMLVIIFAALITSTNKGREMTDALIKLRVPYEIAFMTTVALRFIPQFIEELRNRLNAISMRGINIKKLKFTNKLKLYSYILSPALSGSIIKSRKLSESIESRSFRAYPDRTMLRQLHLRFIDYIIMMSTLIFSIAFLMVMYTS
jgi:energy-coupling factor transport system permease protein